MSRSPRVIAILQALFVTFLWSTSWVFIKIGLKDAIPPLTFAGLRYTLAFTCLLALALRRPALRVVRALSRRAWLTLLALGLLFYTLNQGAQFLGLAALPAAAVNLLLSFSTVLVTILSTFLLAERPTGLQWAGLACFAAGAVVYFYPVWLSAGQALGVFVVLIGVASNAGASLLGRQINRDQHLPPILITTISMGFGSLLLLAAGLATQGLPPLSLAQWGIIGWLAVANTAFAFTLWNHTLRTLSAMESSVINNAMLIQIPILAWVFLGEALDWKGALGIALAGGGILLVQVRRLRVGRRPSGVRNSRAQPVSPEC
jgi:drug/metabolite transporter (DMT)-like permease